MCTRKRLVGPLWSSTNRRDPSSGGRAAWLAPFGGQRARVNTSGRDHCRMVGSIWWSTNPRDPSSGGCCRRRQAGTAVRAAHRLPPHPGPPVGDVAVRRADAS